jgi:hypothetical protein
MDGVVSGDWIYCFVENLPRPLEYLIACCLIVVIAPKVGTAWTIAAASIAIATTIVFVTDPYIDGVFQKLVASIEYLDTGNIYNPPYGWQVNVPSYVTFLEPVIASFAIAALMLSKRSRRPAWCMVQFVLVVMAMKHSIVPTLVYSFYQSVPLPRAILSESQFALEALTLAIITAVGWTFSLDRRDCVASPSTTRIGG